MPVVILSARIYQKTSEVLLIMPNSYTEIYRVPTVKEKEYPINLVRQSQYNQQYR
jgi:hypothetical protein